VALWNNPPNSKREIVSSIRKMTNKIFQILILIIFPVLLTAQKNVSFEAFCDAKKVVIGNYFEVNFTLKNADGKNFTPPSFNGFDILSGPSSSVSTQIINGVMSRQMGYSYTLMPQKVGKFTIGSATIKVNGKTLKTNPLKMEVVKGRTNAAPGSNNGGAQVYIQAEPSATEARIGQQILLDYKLYTTVNIDSYFPMEESNYDGFFSQEIKRINSQVLREVVDGVQYTTKILKRVALYPQQAGVLKIDPIKIRLEMITGKTQNYGFFSRNKTTPVVARTTPVEINVRPFSNDVPASFDGAVGLYSFQSSIENQIISTDDAVRIKVLINGNGDIKRLQAPPLNLPLDSFDVYDSKVLDERIFENQGEINGRKMFELVALPKYPGKYVIQPEFTYYDTDSLKFITLKSPPFKIAVRQGTGLTNSIASSPQNDNLSEDIRFIKMDTKLRKKSSAFFGSTTFWILSILPFIILGGAFTYKQILEKRNNLDIGLLKSRRANKLALLRLKTAKKFLDANEHKSFYDEISRASLGYVCDKLSIPVSELTKDNVRGKLDFLKVSTENIDRFMKIIQTAEMALFAGMDNSAAMTETYDNAINVIAGIEEEIGS
jgi:hypothetical protein